MQIVFYSPRFYPLLGGLERVVQQYARELAALGDAVTIITDTPGVGDNSLSFEVLRCGSPLQQLRLMRAADVVVQFNASLKALPLCLLARSPWVICHQTLLRYPDGRATVRQKLKLWVSNHLAWNNIGCSSYVADQFDKCAVVLNPYDNKVFYDSQASRSPKSLTFVGRLVTDKGADLLLHALHLLHQRQVYFDVAIVGDGPERVALEALTNSLGLKERVAFLGALSGPALASILNSHHILVVPSRVEPFGIIVLEGLACGCNVVASNADGLPESGGGFTTTFTSGSVVALADAIVAARHLTAKPDSAGLKKHLQSCTTRHAALLFRDQISSLARP